MASNEGIEYLIRQYKQGLTLTAQMREQARREHEVIDGAKKRLDKLNLKMNTALGWLQGMNDAFEVMGVEPPTLPPAPSSKQVEP